MYNIRSHPLALMFTAVSIVSMGVVNLASAATAEDLDKDSRQALQTLYKTEPVAETLSRTARAVASVRAGRQHQPLCGDSGLCLVTNDEDDIQGHDTDRETSTHIGTIAYSEHQSR